MEEKEKSTEQKITEAAEIEFLENGYSGAKMTVIAKRAGVTHAMLHYYFRTKENLFNVVLERKLNMLAKALTSSFNPERPFTDQIRALVGAHYDFISTNPQLLLFITNVVTMDDNRKQMLYRILNTKVSTLFANLDELLQREIAKGAIRPISTLNFILNVVGINAVSVIAHPLMSVINFGSDDIAQIIQNRRESNIEFIINGLLI